MFHLPRCAALIDEDVDAQKFFRQLANIDLKNQDGLQTFLEKFRGVKFRVSGISERIMITGSPTDASAEFEQFSLDLWKQYYIQEDVYQLGILEDKSPLEVYL